MVSGPLDSLFIPRRAAIGLRPCAERPQVRCGCGCDGDIHPPRYTILDKRHVKAAMFRRKHLFNLRWGACSALRQPSMQPPEHSIMALNDKTTNRTNATMCPGCADILGTLAVGPGVAAPHGNSTFRSEATPQAPSNGDLECGVVHQNVCIRLRCEKAACTWASTASEDCRAPIIEALEKCLSGCLAVRAKQGTLLGSIAWNSPTE